MATERSSETAASSGSGDLSARFARTRAATTRLIEGLSAEDCQVQSMPEASPAKWHLAHTSWFFETFVLLPARAGYSAFEERYGYLFNSYYEAVGARHARPERGLLTRPSLARVLEYRRHVEEHVIRHLERSTLPPELLALVELGIQHEQQHQELLLTDIGHALSVQPLLPAYVEQTLCPLPEAERLDFSGFDAGQHWLGASGPGFAFDNEGPRHRVWLEAFEMAHRPVTNGEYLELVRSGGYREPSLWLSDGWAAVAARGLERPAYWHERDGRLFEFSLSGLVPLDLAAPVCHLSYYEADAYATFAGATFAGARLPSEAEWEVAARHFADAAAGQWLESGRLHPGTATPGTASAPGPRAFLGDVWEWTRSAYAAYPGYRRAPGALGEYNGKFMCGPLVLRGGSCLSPESHLRVSYRNFFAPGASWQMSGLRLARDADR